MTVPAGYDRPSYERVRAALDARGLIGRERTGLHIDARCPAHDDRAPSLSVDWRESPDRGGFVVLCCHTGCDSRDVVAALGLAMVDLFDRAPRSPAPAQPAPVVHHPTRAEPGPGRPYKGWPPSLGVPLAEYEYRDAAGSLVAVVGRFPPEPGRSGKTFRVRRPHPSRPAYWSLSRPPEMPLYRLPAVVEAVRAGKRVFVVEGEKDADRLAELGVCATSRPFGAMTRPEQWAEHWSTPLAGARVVIVSDRDPAGYRHAAIVRDALAAVAAEVTVVRTPLDQDHADASDHLDAGRPLGDLEPVPAELVPGPGPDPAEAEVVQLDSRRRRRTPELNPGDLPGEFPVPGSPGLRYTPGEAVWKADQPVLPWCPLVTRHLVAWSPRRAMTRRHVTLRVGEVDATVPIREVSDGSVWAERFPDASGTASRMVWEALANIVGDQARRLPVTPLHPRWVGDHLELPPPDVLHRGYTATAGTPADFAALLLAATASPRVGLLMGFAAAGPYVGPTGAQPAVVHVFGRQRSAKTTGAFAAAAVMGFPGASPASLGNGVVRPWSTTEQGPVRWLQTLACLPGFRDDLGASGYTPGKLSKLVFAVSQGAERDSVSRSGEYRDAEAGWHGYVISTGNEGILAQVTNVDGIAARVVEIAGPLVDSAEDAERLERLISAGYGHGLPAIVDRGPAPAEFAEWTAKAVVALDIAGGGVERTLGKHMASAVAGARLLAELFDVPELVPAVEAAAREVLAEMLADLAEHGTSPADRLVTAIAGAMTSSPSRFPTRIGYEQMCADAARFGRTVPEVWGFDTADDDGVPGDVAIIQTAIREIAEPQGITDVGVALRELKRAGRLATRRERRTHQVWVARPTAVASKTPRECYVIRGVFPSASTEPEPGPAPAPTPPQDQKTRAAVTMAETPEPCEACGRPTPVRIDGRPRHLDPCPRPAERPAHPPESQRAPEARPPAPARHGSAQGTGGASPRPARRDGISRATELANFAAILAKGGWSDPGQEALSAGLEIFHQVTDWTLVESQSAGRVGMLAWHRLVARHGSIPEAERTDLPMLAGIRPHKDALDPRWLDRDQALTPGGLVVGVDVNAQFTAGARGCELGTGAPVHEVMPEVTLEWLRQPGYGRLATAPAVPAGPLAGLPAGAWLTTYTLRYLVDDLGVPVELAEAWVWPERRRWLDASAKFWLAARAALIRHDDLPGRLALAAAKLIPNAFYGGWLRSEANNHTVTLRPDWSHMLISRARANALRGMSRAAGNPLGLIADTAYFAGMDAITGLEIPDDPGNPDYRKPGKFKVEKVAPVTPEMTAAHSDTRPHKFRDAVSASDAARREGEGK